MRYRTVVSREREWKVWWWWEGENEILYCTVLYRTDITTLEYCTVQYIGTVFKREKLEKGKEFERLIPGKRHETVYEDSR